MSHIFRGIILLIGFVLLWQAISSLLQLPNYILPNPFLVLHAWQQHAGLILYEAGITGLETLLGLGLGILIGGIVALMMTFFPPINRWLLPFLIISQAIPTFAIAPLLVMWFGFGIASKIIVTVLMLFYPITSAFLDGLKQTEPGWLDLAKSMHASKWRTFYYIRIPAALPALATGLRIATVIAPIGAIVGEWVGASHGLGYLMLNSNARVQIDLMFAALITLILFSLSLYFLVNQLLKWAIPWQSIA